MFSTKKSNIITIPMLLIMFCFLLCAAIAGINYSGITFETKNNDDSEHGYKNTVIISGSDILKLKTCIVIDSSHSGWESVNTKNLIGQIKESLLIFADQGHTVELDGFSLYSGFRSTSAYLPIKSEEDADIWKAFNKFQSMFKNPWGDMPYNYLIKSGVESLLSNNDSGQKVLLLIIGSPDVGNMKKSEAEEIKKMLAENDILLYVIGLKLKGNSYDVLYNLTENVFKEVDEKDIGKTIEEIYCDNAYKQLQSTNTGEITIEIPKAEGEKIHTEVYLNLFSKESFEYSIDKLTRLEDGRDSDIHILSGKCEDFMTTINIDDVEIENASELLRYHILLSNLSDGQKIFYSFDYKDADQVVAPPKFVFEYLDSKLNINSKIITLTGLFLTLLLFAIPLMIRITTKNKYKKYANACESRG